MLHIDLFSGIGGFALALDRVYNDVDHLFVENDPFCQLVLKKHWPNSHIHGDIRTFAANAFRSGHLHGKPQIKPAVSDLEAQREPLADIPAPFILTGGFPCQPFSQAGRRRGAEDDRFLWPEMFRVIRDWQPTWVIAENVRGLLTQGGGVVFEQVCADLEASGYDVQPLIIPAVAVNAPHRRDRVWFIARNAKHDGFNGTKNGKSNHSRIHRDTERKKKVCKPQGTDSVRRDDADTERAGYERQVDKARQSARHRGGAQWDKNWFEVASRFCRVDARLPKRLDRNPRLKALGNAIVPAVAEEIIRAIKSS